MTAICPGSYDPVTNGHVDVITRTAAIFDRVVVGVVDNPQQKSPTFSTDQRIGFLCCAFAQYGNVEIDTFSDLVVDFARRWRATAIVKNASRDVGFRTGTADGSAQPHAGA
jgi:pantetheine-phosphate adenylyltransferase